MIVCYALGGGLGHVTRVRALLHTLGEGGDGAGPVTVLVSSPRALDARVLGGWSALLAPEVAAHSPAALGDWVMQSVARLRPEIMIVDAFPAGVLGELCSRAWPPGLRLVHAARRLQWRRYRRRAGPDPPAFARTFVLEPLEDEHQAALAAWSAGCEELALVDPPAWPEGSEWPPGLEGPESPEGAARPVWLVVHSGPDAETSELVAYAADLRRLQGSADPLLLIAPERPPGLSAEVAHHDLYPAWPLFASAAHIVTACGFNAMRQAEPFGDRHHFLPFPRPLDDQFERAARRRAVQVEERRPDDCGAALRCRPHRD